MSSESIEEYSEANNEYSKLYNLVNSLEAWAHINSPDYADGIDDGCIVSVGHIDRGSRLRTETKFSAERYCEELSPGVFGKEIVTKYDIETSVLHQCPDFESFPLKVREYVQEIGEYTEDDFDSFGDIFAIEFKQVYTVLSDGGFEHEYNLWLNVGQDQLDLCDLYSENDTEPNESEVDMITANDSSDELFSTIFTGEEMNIIANGIKTLAYENSSEKVLDMFQGQIDTIRFMPKIAHIDMAEAIVESIFCDKDRAA